MGAEHVLDLLDDAEEVGSQAIELVDEDDARYLGLVGITPVSFRLRFDAAGTAEDADAAVEHLERTVNLDGEVDVPGGVDDIQAVLVPLAAGRGRLDRDPALLLLLHEVGRGGAVMHFTDLVDLAGELEDAFGRRGFARVDVGKNADVPIGAEVSHTGLPSK